MPFCADTCNGSITLLVTGGTAPYTYSWSNGTTATVVTGLCKGPIDVIVRDANGCTATASYIVIDPAPLTLTMSKQDATCNGCNDGTATATVGGGTPAYSYSWIPNVGFGSTVTNLVAGLYTVCVTDMNGCSICDTVTVGEPGVSVSELYGRDKFVVFPNPSSGTFQLNKNFEEGTIRIFNTLGEEMVFIRRDHMIQLHAPAGVYIMRLRNEGHDVIQKIIVE
jgi:hypothetical protein